ncbi:MAG: DUF6599 family protein [Candidatus Hydrogenedentes bacterium]|nr:DUF6599 family protein [Candidatus Hydrogenedentota bacterium]
MTRYLLALGLAIGAVSARADDEGALAATSAPTPAMLKVTDTIATALELDPPKGWKRAGAVERYVPENMYDKINGRSELYMAYDVIGLTFVSFANDTKESDLIDIYLYDMGTAHNAFGVFSVERGGDEKPVELGRAAYRTGADLIFWKGRYYATMLGPRDAENTDALLLSVGNALAARLEDSPEKLWGPGVLPAKNRVETSIQYFLVDALSLDFLRDTFTAVYADGDEKYKVFVSRQTDAATAKVTHEKYVDYLTKYADNVEASAPITSADAGGGFFDAVFHTDAYVAGVTGVRGREPAIAAAKTLSDALGK